MSSSQFHALRVSHVEATTRDALAIRFELPEPLRERFRYVQGQYLTLRTVLDGIDVRRSYSICAAAQDQQLRVAIKRVADGVFSTWALAHLKPGATVDVMPPQGGFHLPLQPQIARHVVAFAAGSGITPVLSILRTTLLAEPQTRVTLVYGNRASGSTMFREELLDLKDRYLGRLNLVWIMSREAQDITLFNGRIDHAKAGELLQRWITPRTIDAAFVCGPQAMMQDVARALREHGVDTSRIRTELFATGLESAAGAVRPARAPSAGSDECAVEVVLDGTRHQFRMRKNHLNVIDAGLQAGLELPYSCKGGVCSTCRANVVEGEVDMDNNFALEDYELARGFVLCCQSYPRSDTLVLDFDREHAHATP